MEVSLPGAPCPYPVSPDAPNSSGEHLCTKPSGNWRAVSTYCTLGLVSFFLPGGEGIPFLWLMTPTVYLVSHTQSLSSDTRDTGIWLSQTDHIG